MTQGIKVGEHGRCQRGLCFHGGRCIELYDTYECDCTMTPFIGTKCETDVGILVPKGSQLSIPWQHPGHVADCFRIGVQSLSNNYSLIQAKALFADSLFNITVNSKGFLEVSVFDGFFFHHRAVDQNHKLDNDEMVDLKFCAHSDRFVLNVNGEESISLPGNWTFFRQLNSWKFLDKSFHGCIVRLQIGNGFPLKAPSTSRFSYKGDIKFGQCPFDPLIKRAEQTVDEDETDIPSIHIHTIAREGSTRLTLYPIIAFSIASAILLSISIFVCWVRNRPDGVYKTNENLLAYNSPGRSNEPLVINKEYFC
ncbi:hypothetical protein AB6A40_004233 [Gnathostoma spinigerum]|uniref:EGF-like domain-containing protein n=1 Tax=Gnathostoma spinigerum TaxID=75299 RepID=A0ABD6EJJ9_9BILA